MLATNGHNYIPRGDERERLFRRMQIIKGEIRKKRDRRDRLLRNLRRTQQEIAGINDSLYADTEDLKRLQERYEEYNQDPS